MKDTIRDQKNQNPQPGQPPEAPEEEAARKRGHRRNLVIALILLVFLALAPFWDNIIGF